MTIFTNLTLLLLMFHSGIMGNLRPDEELAIYKEKYPDEPVIFLEKKENIDYQLVNDSIITTITVYEEVLHLGENTKRYASDRVYSSSFSKVSDLKAYTLIPGKKKYDRIDIEEFKESYDKDSYVFFDDTKEISFTYPGIQKGAKTVLEYKKTIKDPRLIGMFFMESYRPIHEGEYIITHDKEININPQLFNNEDLEVHIHEKELDDHRKQSSFKVNEVKKLDYESNAPSFSSISASVYAPIKDYVRSDGEIIEVVSTTSNLHKWYRSLISDIQKKDKSIEELVGSIVGPEDSELEKVKKIYDWVQSNIKYIAFEDGMRGFIPHPGNYVIEKRYGDCKDMASAIVSMLREADIDGNYSWIGTRELPYRYTEVPSPITDNHMIATFTHDDEIYFLDATGSYSPMDLPTSMIQGKECLISYGNDDFKVVEVPVIPKERSTFADTVSITIEQGVVKGKGNLTMSGYGKVYGSYRLIKSNEKKIEEYLQKLLEKGNNKFQLENYEVSNLEDLYEPIEIHYDFSIPDYYREVGNNIYINVILDKSMTDAMLEDRKQPHENRYKYINRDVTILKIPEGFDLKNLPQNINMETKNFGFDISYERSEAEIIVTKEYYVDYLIMEVNEFEEWNSVITDYAKACRKAIILSRK